MNIKTGALSLALLSFSVVYPLADQDVIEKSFDVRSGGKLVMKVDRGSIRINAADIDKVQVTVTRELRQLSGAKAREVFDQHKIDLSSDQNTVSILAQNPQKLGGWFGGSPMNKLRVEYNISLPRKFDLNLRTAGGNIEVNELDGAVNANTAGGNIKLGAITGPLELHTSGGNISIATGSGDVKVHTSGGNIQIGDVHGNLVASTSGGNIDLHTIHGSADARTSGGHIRVKGAKGPLIAKTSGGNVSAELLEQPKASCELRTSGGHVDLTLSEQMALNLDAHTSGGRISSDFDGEMNKQKTKLTARLNGGGPDVVLGTSGGNVNIRRR